MLVIFSSTALEGLCDFVVFPFSAEMVLCIRKQTNPVCHADADMLGFRSVIVIEIKEKKSKNNKYLWFIASLERMLRGKVGEYEY